MNDPKDFWVQSQLRSMVKLVQTYSDTRFYKGFSHMHYRGIEPRVCQKIKPPLFDASRGIWCRVVGVLVQNGHFHEIRLFVGWKPRNLDQTSEQLGRNFLAESSGYFRKRNDPAIVFIYSKQDWHLVDKSLLKQLLTSLVMGCKCQTNNRWPSLTYFRVLLILHSGILNLQKLWNA